MWLKIKIWTKGIVFAAIAVYVLLFLYNNSSRAPVKFWYWFGHEPETSPLLLAFLAFVGGAIVAILLRTTFTTLRQIREMRAQNRLERLEREHAEMKAKAAMLQTRTAPTSTPSSPPQQSPLE
jgi:uncharacterized integral membrane protein